jgi:predicted type IV restriction endonuclease
LVTLGFSHLHLDDLMEEVNVVLPLLASVGLKMLKPDEVIGSQLEAEGRVLAEVVAEHVLMRFWS